MTLFTRAGTHASARHSSGGIARRSGRWVAMVAAVAAAPLAATAVVLPSGGPAGAAGTPVISETFQNANVASPTSWVTPAAPSPETNLACLTAGSNTTQTPIRDCSTSGTADGSGVLRLTDPGLSEEGGVLTSLSVPASSGLDATFDSYQYGGSNPPADGIGFVISAENPADPVAPANIGEPGGDLGYSAAGGPGGLADGYLGVGLDTFGNYTNPGYDGTGCTDPSWAGFSAGQVTVRGPGNGAAGYCLLNSSKNVFGGSQDLSGSTPANSEVPVEVLINTTAASQNLTSPAFSSDVVPAGDYGVAWTPLVGGSKFFASPLPSTTNGGLPSNLYPAGYVNPATGIPFQLGFGWVGSTGSLTNFHEISNGAITTLLPVPVLTTSISDSDSGQLPLGGTDTYTLSSGVTAAGGNENDPVTLTATLPAGVTPGTASGTGWSCTTAGQTVTCTYAPPVAAGTTLPNVTFPASISASASTATNALTSSVTVSSDDGNPATANDPGTAIDNPAIKITKSANPTSYAAPNTVITYSYLVQNIGDVPLTNVDVTDPMPNLSPVICTDSSLAAGAQETCSATYSTTQQDVDNGSITNTGTASGTAPSGAVVTAMSTTTVGAVQNPAVTISKSANPTTVTAAGQTIGYSFVVTNTGNVTLSNIAVTDAQSVASEDADLSPILCPDASLAPQGFETCTATYTVTQADMDAGSITDTGSVSATGPSSVGVATVGNSSSTTVSATQSPAISLSKSASPGVVHELGNTVTYTFSIGNPGNVTLHGVGVTDQQAAPALNSGLSSITCVSGTSGPSVTNGSITLAPGGTATCTATYAATAADFANGSINDTAKATGIAPLGASTSASSSATVVASAPIMTGEANDATVAVALLGKPLPLALVLHDTGAVATTKASTTLNPCAVNLPLADLLTSGDVCSDVTTVPATTLTPATSDAQASVAAVAIGVPSLPVIDVQAVQSNSVTTCLGSLGSTTIAYLKVGSTVVISKPTVIAPNTTLTIGLVTLVLNQQIPLTGPDHGLIVSAVDVRANVLGLVQANVSVASSESDIENC